MPQSLSHIIVHIIFSTKNREPFVDTEIEPSLHAYLATLCRNQGCHAYRVGGTRDHVHLGTTLARTIPVSGLIKHIKETSSAWAKTQGPGYRDFFWQRGYGAFSVSPTHLDELVAYISGQQEHHKKETFQEEFLKFLKKYGIDYDERYVWD